MATIRLWQSALSGLFALVSSCALAQASANPPAIHIVYMGGDDCPPCVAWRRSELPKLQKSAAFKEIRFSYVIKTIKSPVPPAFFLPDEVKPLKAKLDRASSGLSGSPQFAVFVNGEVFDYYRGTRSAEDVLSMLAAIKGGAVYPFERCLKRASRGCEIGA